MPDIVTRLQLENAKIDAQTLENFVNDDATPGTLTSRLGTPLKSIAKIIEELSLIDIGGGAAALINGRLDLIQGDIIDLEERVTEIEENLPVTSKVLFDSTVDTYANKFMIDSNAALTFPTPNTVRLNSSSLVSLFMKLKTSTNTLFDHAYDKWKITANITLQSINSAGIENAGVTIGIQSHTGSGDKAYGMKLRTLPSPDEEFYSAFALRLVVEQLPIGTPTVFMPGDIFKLTTSRDRESIKATLRKTGGNLISVTDTPMSDTPTLMWGPEMFGAFALHFRTGDFVINSLKIEVPNFGADFCFIGDSITQGKLANSYAGGFPQILRRNNEQYKILVCGATGSTSTEWVTNIESIQVMNPQKVFLMIGVNEFLYNTVTFTQWKINVQAIIDALELVGAEVILLGLTPVNGFADIENVWNAWLKTLPNTYIDTFNPMVGTTPYRLAFAYAVGAGDGWINLNGAGHARLAQLIQPYLTV